MVNFRDEGSGYCVGDTAAVGSYPSGASPYGVLDIGGNVWEWVNDWYDEDYYALSPRTNPQGPSSGDARGIRGGAWLDYSWEVRTSVRGGRSPDDWHIAAGFRCARSQ